MAPTGKQKKGTPGHQERTRRHHTRSRDGCVTCRKRHVRCDETRPACINCQTGNRNCEYAPAPIPLRERRAKEKAEMPPGAQEVWAVSSLSSSSTPEPSNSSISWKFYPSASFDPFDSLGIKMPFRSVQLMRYFYDTADAMGVAPSNPQDDCMAIVAHQPGALRSTLILAGLHYTWNQGALAAYESTILFHKVECIRAINETISNPTGKGFTSCIRQVATLTISECLVGNRSLSRAHEQGLHAVMEARQTQKCRDNLPSDSDDELSDRYLLLIYNFVYGLKSPLGMAHDFAFLPENVQQKVTSYKLPETRSSPSRSSPSSPSSSTCSAEKQRPSHKQQPSGKQDSIEKCEEPGDFRLAVLRLTPYFFAPPPPEVPAEEVDVPSFLNCVQDMSDMCEIAHAAPTLEERVLLYHDMWNEGPAVRYFTKFVDTHRHSFFAGRVQPKLSPTGDMVSTWTGLAAPAGLYLNSLLDIWYIGQQIEPRMLRHFLELVHRDCDLTRASLNMPGSPASDLWLWKAYIGAMSVTRASIQSEVSEKGLLGLQDAFDGFLRLWSQTTGQIGWEQARQALRRVVWTKTPLDEGIERGVWELALMKEFDAEADTAI